METLTSLLTSAARDHSIRRGHYDKSSDYHLEIELRTFHCQWLFPILSIIWSKNLPNWSMLCVVGQQHVDSLNYRWSWSLKINDFTSLSVNIHVSGLHTYKKMEHTTEDMFLLLTVPSIQFVHLSQHSYF